ncbi:MAG: ROK family protein, partial [Phycisphaerales bacterium JB059]
AARDPDGVWRTAISDRYGATDPETVRRAIDDAIEAIDGSGEAPTVVGVCLPGVLDESGARVAYAANLPGLIGAEIRGLLPASVGSGRVRVASDAVCAGVGAWLGEPVSGRLLTLAMGTGVGACVLDHGRPVTLDGRSVGHVGQLDVSLDPEAPLGPDGGRGSLEAYVGAPALRARFGEDLAPALAGLEASDPALRALARALRICHAIYTPDHVRLCGGVGAMLASALPLLRSLVERDLTLVARERWSLACVDDLHLGAKGAAHLGAQSGAG